MIICKTRSELSACLSDKNAKIGFVPTMGALHEGHLSLIRSSKSKADITVCSIFVNPTQFNDHQDFEKYPSTIDADVTKLQTVDCDVLFLPSVEEMYGRKNLLSISFGVLEEVLEGAFRPGHFNGVATIVSKLFHHVKPDIAFFGQKDLQQFAVIHELVAALSFDVELVMCPIIREENGLAMSSRNERLRPIEREKAKIISETISLVKEVIINEKSVTKAVSEGQKRVLEEPLFELEYLSVVDQLSLQEIKEIVPNRKTAVCIAGKIGDVRLIDNIVF